MSLRIVFVDGRRGAGTKRGSGDRPMGGISSAAVGLRTLLARRGHEVHYFATSTSSKVQDGVHLHDRSKLAEFAARGHIDVLIAIPDLLSLLVPLRARGRIVWTGNAFAHGDLGLVVPWPWAPHLGKRGKEARLYPMALFDRVIDRVMVGSLSQARHLSKASNVAAEKFVVAYLGVPLEYYRGPDPNRDRHRLVYTSQANRGLDVLLRLFPKIKERVPDTELHVFGNEYSEAGIPLELDGAMYPGVVWRGTAGKSDLARELRSSAVMAYPCTFNETFCISVAEAQAAGLPVVTTDLAALSERVDHSVNGFLVSGSARAREYGDKFVEHVTHLLQDDALWLRMSKEATRIAHAHYDWDAIALQWETTFQELVTDREPLFPNHDDGLDLLTSELLRIRAPGATADVPPDTAARWLQDAWEGYGFDRNTAPGLVRST